MRAKSVACIQRQPTLGLADHPDWTENPAYTTGVLGHRFPGRVLWNDDVLPLISMGYLKGDLPSRITT
jgi:hypothetical protein